jgi:hypothetical protein
MRLIRIAAGGRSRRNCEPVKSMLYSALKSPEMLPKARAGVVIGKFLEAQPKILRLECNQRSENRGLGHSTWCG